MSRTAWAYAADCGSTRRIALCYGTKTGAGRRGLAVAYGACFDGASIFTSE